VNFADLSRTLGLPQTTLKRYFALLEATFLCNCSALVEQPGAAAHSNPKFIWMIRAAAHSLGLTSAAEGGRELARGAGDFVLRNCASIAWSEIQPEFYYWRTALDRKWTSCSKIAPRLVGLK